MSVEHAIFSPVSDLPSGIPSSIHYDDDADDFLRHWPFLGHVRCEVSPGSRLRLLAWCTAGRTVCERSRVVEESLEEDILICWLTLSKLHPKSLKRYRIWVECNFEFRDELKVLKINIEGKYIIIALILQEIIDCYIKHLIFDN